VNYTLVGTFVLFLGGVLVAGALWLASGGAFQKKYDNYLAVEDESVAGLNLNAPVKYLGVDIGKVVDIRLDAANPQRVILRFAIERGVPIKDDTVAVLKTQGLTGITYVELSGGAQNAPLLVAKDGNAYPLIRTKPSLSARLENVLSSVLGKLDSTSSHINAVLGEENQAAFKSALADIAQVARTLAEHKAAIGSGIDHAALASSRAVPAIERIERAAQSIETMGHEVAHTSARAGQTVTSIGADVQRFTAETLPELERLLGELNVLSTSLRRLTEQTESNPSSLLFGRKSVPDGPGEANGKTRTPTGADRP
jgi:phospholipid/cholesterol/gamma-HCH transport system substrate-binding protein